VRGATMFSGIGAPETAAPFIDWLWCAEIEPFPSAVMAVRHPQTVNLGDITAPDFIDRAKEFGPLDVLVAGPPCQAFSVAGLRNSLSDHRGNLSLVYARAIDALDPQWVITENVPGWLSTKDNAFGCFLSAVVGGDAPLVPPGGRKWPDSGVAVGPKRAAAWTILDAQYFGLAQRRRRVFVAIERSGDGSRPAEILFERESVFGNTPPSREARERSARTTAPGLTGSGRGVERVGESRGQDPVVVAHTLRADGFDASEDGTGRGTPLVLAHGQGNAEIVSDGSPSLTCNHEAPIAFYQTDGLRFNSYNDLSPTIKVGSSIGIPSPPAIYFSRKDHGNDLGEVSPPLRFVRSAMSVRRLTPRECERLQGFPDDYTSITYSGKLAADGPRYKALGNSMAVPVVAWILRRLERVHKCG